MRIQFEKFTEEYIGEAVQLALAEFEMERTYCPDLPCFDFKGNIERILRWLGSQPFGKVALCDGKLVGYLLFAGPWDGVHGNVKGVFSPLGGSAFLYEHQDRRKLISMLFANVAQDLVKENIYSCALSRYAHDTESAESFVFNGFGIRCMDTVRDMTGYRIQNSLTDVLFEELTRKQFCEVEHLQRGLHHHLLCAPVFFPLPQNGFEDWFSEWTKRESMRIFVAKKDEKTIGFIAVETEGENYVTVYETMKNICGAYFEENYRGTGIAQGLLAYVFDVLKAEGVTHMGVDCETMNPTAFRFWNKYFVPYTYSFARRIDERVRL